MTTVENIQPLVSVLIAAYNQEKYIGQTLDSILMQQCSFDFEIIIGEDCSTDGTREICLEYQEKYPDQIVLCLNERNKGLLDNYFDIFLKCRGKYIADCGGDDYWLTTQKLQEQVDLLEKHGNVSLVAGNWLLYKQKTALLENSNSQIPEDWYHPECFGKQAVASYLNESVIPRVVLASSCFRKDWALEAYHAHSNLFRSKDVTCEDIPITLCLLMKGPFYFQRKTYLVYRVLGNSLSHSDSLNTYMRGFAYNTFKHTVRLAKILGVTPGAIPNYIQTQVGNFALHAFINRDQELMKSLWQDVKILDVHLRIKQRILYICMIDPVIYNFTRGLYLQCNRLSFKRKST